MLKWTVEHGDAWQLMEEAGTERQIIKGHLHGDYTDQPHPKETLA